MEACLFLNFRFVMTDMALEEGWSVASWSERYSRGTTCVENPGWREPAESVSKSVYPPLHPHSFDKKEDPLRSGALAQHNAVMSQSIVGAVDQRRWSE